MRGRRAGAGLTWWLSRCPCGTGPLPTKAMWFPVSPSHGGPQSTGPQRRWWSLVGFKWGRGGSEPMPPDRGTWAT